jgi:hypothetical protein
MELGLAWKTKADEFQSVCVCPQAGRTPNVLPQAGCMSIVQTLFGKCISTL